MFLLEDARLDPENLGTPLVPLEAVQTLGELVAEAGLDVVVDAEVLLDQLAELAQNLIRVLIEQPLQLGHLLVVVEVLLVLGVQLREDGEVVLECVQQLVHAPLLGHVAGHLQLLVLLVEALVELRQLLVDVIFDVLLLVAHDLNDFVLEARLRLSDQFFQLVEHVVQKRRQIIYIHVGGLFALCNFLLNVAEVASEIGNAVQAARYLRLFRLKGIQGQGVHTRHLGSSGLVSLLLGDVLGDTLFAQGAIVGQNYRLWKVFQTQILDLVVWCFHCAAIGRRCGKFLRWLSLLGGLLLLLLGLVFVAAALSRALVHVLSHLAERTEELVLAVFVVCAVELRVRKRHQLLEQALQF